MEATIGFFVFGSASGQGTQYAFPHRIPKHPVIDWIAGNMVVRGTVELGDKVVNLEERWCKADTEQIKKLVKGILKPVRLQDLFATQRNLRGRQISIVRELPDDVILLNPPTVQAYYVPAPLMQGLGEGTLITAPAVVAALAKVDEAPSQLDLADIGEVLASGTLPPRQRRTPRHIDEAFVARLASRSAEPDF